MLTDKRSCCDLIAWKEPWKRSTKREHKSKWVPISVEQKQEREWLHLFTLYLCEMFRLPRYGQLYTAYASIPLKERCITIAQVNARTGPDVGRRWGKERWPFPSLSVMSRKCPSWWRPLNSSHKISVQFANLCKQSFAALGCCPGIENTIEPEKCFIDSKNLFSKNGRNQKEDFIIIFNRFKSSTSLQLLILLMLNGLVHLLLLSFLSFPFCSCNPVFIDVVEWLCGLNLCDEKSSHVTIQS